ncbi:MAG: hypothetical protein ACJ77K_06715 [Bacteroidia bacterium]|jgi:hypothetical protein
MNKVDEYAFWVMRAISEPTASSNEFFFDKYENELFGIKNRNVGLKPIFRNKITEEDPQIVELFSKKIEALRRQDPNIIQLPKLSLAEKTNFLSRFIDQFKSHSLYTDLKNEIEGFSERDQFGFKIDLKAIDPKLFLQFDMEKGRFIANMVKQIYSPLGISEKSLVIW